MITLDRIVFHSFLMHCVNNYLLSSRLLPPASFSWLSLCTLTLWDGVDGFTVAPLCCTSFYSYLAQFFGLYTHFRNFRKQHDFYVILVPRKKKIILHITLVMLTWILTSPTVSFFAWRWNSCHMNPVCKPSQHRVTIIVFCFVLYLFHYQSKSGMSFITMKY